MTKIIKIGDIFMINTKYFQMPNRLVSRFKDIPVQYEYKTINEKDDGLLPEIDNLISSFKIPEPSKRVIDEAYRENQEYDLKQEIEAFKHER